ncbi:MAG: hypothetical protein MJZ73_03335 [Bacteroidaceae bacterium]|nr:hypothetical protein [Bacteroidaceae bacterium]
MGNIYQEALTLFHSGDYEGAFAMLKDIDSDPQATILKYKCLVNIEKQYSNLIEDAGKHGRKDDQDLLYQDYVRKYGESSQLENLMGLNQKSSPKVNNSPKVIEVEKNYTFGELLSEYLSVTMLMISLATSIIILMIIWGGFFYKKADLEQQLTEQKSLYQKKKYEDYVLSITIEKYAKESPVIIKGIKVRNENQNYGEKIYSSKTTYLIPQIECLILKSHKAQVDVKFITPYGLSTGTVSRRGYSYSRNVDFEWNYRYDISTYEIGGWGGDDLGHWSPGKYKMEFYIKDKKIGSTSFTIY